MTSICQWALLLLPGREILNLQHKQWSISALIIHTDTSCFNVHTLLLHNSLILSLMMFITLDTTCKLAPKFFIKLSRDTSPRLQYTGDNVCQYSNQYTTSRQTSCCQLMVQIQSTSVTKIRHSLSAESYFPWSVYLFYLLRSFFKLPLPWKMIAQHLFPLPAVSMVIRAHEIHRLSLNDKSRYYSQVK